MTDWVKLTEPEIDLLNECECGHFKNEHSSDGCLANVDDPDEGIEQDDGTVMCVCSHSPDAINRNAIEAILNARLRPTSPPKDMRPQAHSREDCWCGMPHRMEDFL